MMTNLGDINEGYYAVCQIERWVGLVVPSVGAAWTVTLPDASLDCTWKVMVSGAA